MVRSWRATNSMKKPLARLGFGVVVALGIAGVSTAETPPPAFASDHASLAVVAAHPQQRYFLFPPRSEPEAEHKKPGLLVVIPGGRGDESLRPLYGALMFGALPTDFVIAQLVSTTWFEGQQLVWPTPIVHEVGADFYTPEFVEAVIQNVQRLYDIDSERVFVFGASSGGPAAYYSAIENPIIKGAFVWGSVFKPEHFPGLEAAKGKRFFLYQSPDDEITAIDYARDAYRHLSAAGAAVKLCEYEGGHSFLPLPKHLPTVATGFAWLGAGQQRDASDPCAATQP